MSLNKKFCIVLFFICGFVFSVFAEDWNVCLASYKKNENAISLLKDLDNNKIPAGIAFYYNNGETLYRVFYDKPVKTPEEARKQIKELETNSIINKLNLNGLWICQGTIQYRLGDKSVTSIPEISMRETEEIEPESVVPEKVVTVVEPVVEPVVKPVTKTEETKKILSKNTENPLSEEVPYSVLVHSYAEEKSAERDSKKLKEEKIDSYILKKYDDKSYFKFDLHAGAFATEEEAEALNQKLEQLGIEDSKVTDYNDFSEKIEKYNSVIDTQKVTFNDYSNEIPDLYSENVKDLLKKFPINTDYQVEKILVCDYLETEDNDYEERLAKDLKDFSSNLTECIEDLDEYLAAFIFGEVKDDLFNKTVSILVLKTNNSSYNDNEYKQSLIDEIDFVSGNIRLNGKIYQTDDSLYLTAFSPENKICCLMETKDMNLEQLKNFLSKIDGNQDLLYYPQIRRTMLVLPEGSEERDCSFSYLRMEKLDKRYVEVKNYADWAIPMEGHWCTDYFLTQNYDNFYIGFFDLDYDYNAKKIHEMFMDSHRDTYIDSKNHPVDVKDSQGWFLQTSYFSGEELSFTSKSYIISIDTERVIYDFSEPEFVEYAEEMKIWE